MKSADEHVRQLNLVDADGSICCLLGCRCIAMEKSPPRAPGGSLQEKDPPPSYNLLDQNLGRGKRSHARNLLAQSHDQDGDRNLLARGLCAVIPLMMAIYRALMLLVLFP
jgi:hypothetical protein